MYKCVVTSLILFIVFYCIGEVAQVCRDLGIQCLAVQPSEQLARALLDNLGFDELGLEEEEQEQDIQKEVVQTQDTEELLKELSEAEKVSLRDGKGSRDRKTLGTTTHSTRSKGKCGSWSKTLNPDCPIQQ
jgi:hypothetical protein